MKMFVDSEMMPLFNLAMYDNYISFENLLVLYNSGENFVESINNFNVDKYRKYIERTCLDVYKDVFETISDTIRVEVLDGNKANYHYDGTVLNFLIDVNESDMFKISSMIKNDGRFFFMWANIRYMGLFNPTVNMPVNEADFFKSLNSKDMNKAISMYIVYLFEKIYGDSTSTQAKFEMAIYNNFQLNDFMTK